jgi:GAF domain-containing protein
MEQLPTVLAQILAEHSDPKAVFSALMPAVGEVLQCDRCFLYLRNPQTLFGKVPFCWQRSNDFPNVNDPESKQEPTSLPKEDPLFAAALRTEPSIFVEDVETASPEIVNLAFERQTFGHRALIHAHLCQDGALWGILQPCIFGKPRIWTQKDRSIIAQLEKKITPLAVAYVKASGF